MGQKVLPVEDRAVGFSAPAGPASGLYTAPEIIQSQRLAAAKPREQSPLITLSGRPHLSRDSYVATTHPKGTYSWRK